MCSSFMTRSGEVAEFKEKTKDFSEMSFFEREHIIFPPAQAERPREYEVAPVVLNLWFQLSNSNFWRTGMDEL